MTFMSVHQHANSVFVWSTDKIWQLKHFFIFFNFFLKSALDDVYVSSPDMQMLLNLLVETEGVWAAVLILSLFDGKFKNEFKVMTTN
jgi:hypothetical protein